MTTILILPVQKLAGNLGKNRVKHALLIARMLRFLYPKKESKVTTNIC